MLAERGSIGKRISQALGFKKKSPASSKSPVLGSSPQSPRVTFDHEPEIIGESEEATAKPDN